MHGNEAGKLPILTNVKCSSAVQCHILRTFEENSSLFNEFVCNLGFFWHE
jgi:hypothetical protein